MNINELLIEQLKSKLDVKKDQELASVFNVTPFVFSAWKRSRYKLLYETIRYGLQNNLDFNSMFYGLEESMDKRYASVRVLRAEDLFSYYLNPEEQVTDKQRYVISFLEESTIGFQVISQNMEPNIVVSSYVFGSPIQLENIEIGNIYILNIKEKGIFMTRFSGQVKSDYHFDNDNPKFNAYSFKGEDIVEVFRVEANFKKF